MDLGQENINSERLLLRSFNVEDSDDCFAFFSDKICCYNAGGYEPFKTKDKEYTKLMKKLSKEELRKVIVLKATNKVIGTISIKIIDGHTVEIGYVLAKKYWLLGYTSEALTALIDYLFNHTPIDNVIAATIEQNEISVHLLEKLGFKYYKTKKEVFNHPVYGQCDLLYFSKKK